MAIRYKEDNEITPVQYTVENVTLLSIAAKALGLPAEGRGWKQAVLIACVKYVIDHNVKNGCFTGIK